MNLFPVLLMTYFQRHVLRCGILALLTGVSNVEVLWDAFERVFGSVSVDKFGGHTVELLQQSGLLSEF